jgi:3-oxoacid CoA-transferase
MIKTIRKSFTKVYPSSEAATFDVKTGSSILIGGFGLCGMPENLLRAISKKDINDLTLYTALSGTTDLGPGLLIKKKMVSVLNTCYIGNNEEAERQYLNGELEINFIPMGSLVERFRAGSHGILGFYAKAGVGTLVEHGNFPTKFRIGGKTVEKYSIPKKTLIKDNKTYLYEESITADFSLVKAWKADTAGNLIYRKTSRNTNADISGASKITIAEVEEIVPIGELDPDQIHTPGIFVQRVFKGEYFEKPIERLTLNKGEGISIPGTPEQIRIREMISKRASKEIKDGMFVNLGIGIPTLVPNYISKDINIVIHAENGVLGVGPYPRPGEEDSDLINAGKESVTMTTGASTFSSSTSFGIIRGNHLDLTILGGLQVSQEGDLASWIVPGKLIRGIGGSMDLVSSNSKCIVCMEHTAKGAPKVLDRCSLPLTGKQVVDLLITDFGVFEFRDTGMTLTEIAEGVTLDQIKTTTTAKYDVASDLKKMKQ